MTDNKPNQSGKEVSPTEGKKKKPKRVNSKKKGRKDNFKATAERREKVAELWKRGISNVDMAKGLHVTEAQIRADKKVIATTYSQEFRDDSAKMYMAEVGPSIDEIKRKAMKIVDDDSISEQVRINAMGRVMECNRQFGDMLKNAGLIAQTPEVQLTQDNRQVNIKINVPEDYAKEHAESIEKELGFNVVKKKE